MTPLLARTLGLIIVSLGLLAMVLGTNGCKTPDPDWCLTQREKDLNSLYSEYAPTYGERKIICGHKPIGESK